MEPKIVNREVKTITTLKYDDESSQEESDLESVSETETGSKDTQC